MSIKDARGFESGRGAGNKSKTSEEERVFRETANSRTFSRRSIHGQVAHELGLRIVSGVFPPDSTLPNEEIFSAELKVSRTVYREAVKVLAAKGLVEPRPKTGTRIRPRKEWNMLDPDVLAWCFDAGPSTSHARSLFEMRHIIEPAAAAMAAERANEEQTSRIERALETMRAAAPNTDDSVRADLEFHQSIIEASGNDLLTSLGYVIESALAQSFELSTRSPGARVNSIPLHENVLKAIRKHDPDAARAATNTLLESAWNDIKGVIARLSDNRNSADAAESAASKRGDK